MQRLNLDHIKVDELAHPRESLEIETKIQEPKESLFIAMTRWFNSKIKDRISLPEPPLVVPETEECKILIDKLQVQEIAMQELDNLLQKKTKVINDFTSYPHPENKETNKAKLEAWAFRVKSTNKCDICGSRENLQAHHLWDKKSHPTLMYQDENGIPLCQVHHSKFHQKYTNKSQVTPQLYNTFKILEQTRIRLGWDAL